MSIETVTLRERNTGTRAKIAVAFGFNCYEFVANVNGREVDVLWSPPDFVRGDCRPSGSGIPLLFPFPGRLRGTTFPWQGRNFELPEGDGRGNAIHGFVVERPWRVIDQSESRVVGQFQASTDDASILRQWPADFRITATYEIGGNRLSSSFLIENPDDHPLPCGFGTHPYFRLPLGGNAAESCIVELPVRRQWELVDMLPTGRNDELPDADRYQRGLAFGEMTYDDVFAGLVFDKHICRCNIKDPDSRARMQLTFGREFRECVVYTPPHREAICIEPYTCVPGSWGLSKHDTNFGLRVLQPGESFTAEVAMDLSMID